jgi:hypothetical protein
MTSLYNKDRDVIRRFDSPSEYSDYLSALEYKTSSYDGDDFYGMSFDKALRTLSTGDDALLPRAQSVINELTDQNIFSSGVPLMRAAVNGFVPLVPAVLQGHPEAFLTRYRDDAQSMNAPLSIYIETVVSAGVSAQQLANRGIATLGFVLAMQNIRPIELYVSTIGGNNGAYGAAVKISTTPLDLMRATWMMTSNAYYRCLGFAAICEARNERGDPKHSYISWAWYGSPTSDIYISSMREALGMQSDDIFITGGHLIDKLMLNDPVAWVKQMIEKHTQRGEQ